MGRTKAKRLMKTSKENEALKMSLRILTEEADNLRVDMKGKEELEKRFHELESSLKIVLDEAACLKKEKEALEEKIFDLELEQKRQLYQTEGILRFHLNNSTGEGLSRKLLICPSDVMSSTSSGFVSGCSNSWGQRTHPLVTTTALPSS